MMVASLERFLYSSIVLLLFTINSSERQFFQKSNYDPDREMEKLRLARKINSNFKMSMQ